MLHYIAITLRSLIKKPSYTIPAVLALGLAIGANTAVFTIVNAVLLRALPYPDSSRLVVVGSVNRKSGKVGGASPLDMKAWRESSTFITGITAMHSVRFTAIAGHEPVVVDTGVVSPSFFDLTGVKPIVGRVLRSEDDMKGAPPVALISRSFWAREFDSSDSAVGKSINLDTKPYTVIGVVDSTAKFPLTIEKAEVWVPMIALPTPPRGVRFATVVGRLESGATLSQAQSQMDGIAKQLGDTVTADKGFGISVSLLQDKLVGRVRNALWFLQGAVLFLLLIACANVAHLGVVSALSRAQETALRVALGARRRQIVYQWAFEDLMLGLASAVLGIALAYLAIRAFLISMPNSLPRLGLVRVDFSVVAFTLAITCVAALLFTLVRAAMIWPDDLTFFLRGGRSVGVLSGRWLRSGLVVAEVGLTLMLSVGAGTLVRSLLELVRTSWGFDPNQVLVMDVVLPISVYGMGAKPSAFFKKALDNVRGVHGVDSAAIGLTLPFSGEGLSTGVTVVNQPAPAPGHEPRTRYRPISPGYFKTMRIPFLRGRDFESRDRTGAPGVAIIDETLANMLWPNEDPIGQRVQTGVKLTPADPADWEIVGVVRAVKDSPDEPAPPPHLYVPHLQQGWSLMSLVVRTGQDPLSLSSDVKQAIRAVNPTQGVEEVTTLSDRMSKSVALPRLYAVLLSAFAVIGLVLSCVGTYGSIAYSVSQRTREFGVRMALGAESGDLTRMIVGQGGVLVAAGLLLGAFGALALKRSLTSISSEVHGISSVVFLLVAILVAVTGLAACYVPARRASRLNPAGALRYE